MRSDWSLPICTGAERLKDEAGRKLHPTQKPESLLARIILAASRPDDLVLDPFFGTGTTGAVAKRLGRRFLGLEQDPAYVAAAERRIAAVEAAPDHTLAPLPSRRSEARVPFAALVEAGLVAPGLRLRAADGQEAVVRADGLLALGPIAGSIHKLGALVQGLPACNGWTFWQVEIAGRWCPIDDLRTRYRARLAEAG